MLYRFPESLSINEVRDAIHAANARVDTNVFIEGVREDYIVFNYAISFPEVFPQVNTGDAALDREYAILRECRGLTFHKDGRLAARKFHKFFNVGERPETLADAIDWTRPHRILTKEDGSMITPFVISGGVRWQTKMGDTDVARKVYPFVLANPQYEAFARACVGLGMTPLFEWCSRSQRIVIDYPEDRLVLLAVRDNITGLYADHETLLGYGDGFGIEVVDAQSSRSDVDTFLAECAGLLGIEGYIVAFEDGHRVKIKTDEYRTIHRVVSDIASEKAVLQMICENKLDDALPLLPAEDREHVLAFSRDLHKGVAATADEVKALAERGYRETGARDGREFAEWVKVNVPQLLTPHVFNAARDRDPAETLLRSIGKSLGSGPRIDAVRSLWGGLRWDWGNQIARRVED